MSFRIDISDGNAIHEGDTKRLVIEPLDPDDEAAELASLSVVFIRPEGTGADDEYDLSDTVVEGDERALYHTFDVPGDWGVDAYAVDLNGYGERTQKSGITVTEKLRN